MPVQALALVILAGLVHASWNIVAKKASGDARFAFFTSIIMMVFWAPLAWWAGADAVPDWTWREWAAVSASGLVHVAYFVTLLRGYRHADLTVVYPVARGSGPLLSSALAVMLLGETLSALAVLGIALIVGGVVLIAGGPRLLSLAEAPEARGRLKAGVLYGMLTGTFIASYTVVDGFAVKVLLISPILVDYMGNLIRVVLLTPVALQNREEAMALWRTQWKAAAVVGIMGPVAYVMVMYAMQWAPLSHVAPAREVSMLFAALIGGHLLQEGDCWVRLAGAVAIAAGVMALGLG